MFTSAHNSAQSQCDYENECGHEGNSHNIGSGAAAVEKPVVPQPGSKVHASAQNPPLLEGETADRNVQFSARRLSASHNTLLTGSQVNPEDGALGRGVGNTDGTFQEGMSQTGVNVSTQQSNLLNGATFG